MTDNTTLKSIKVAKQATKLSEANYSILQQFVRAESGIVLEGDKRYLLESRLSPILNSPFAASLGIHTLDDLSRVVLSRSPSQLTALILDAVTTNETLFFRDAAMFDALRTQLLPSMLNRVQGSRKLRIWSAASSSGQEAYSVAMMLQELGSGPAHAEIIGTDISADILKRASRARYAQSEVNRGLPREYLTKYFAPAGTEWQLCEHVRSMVRFESIDLRRNIAKLGRFDLILCRNVLIYFDTPTRKQILDALEGMLLPHGMLALGCAETVINIHDGFRRQQIGAGTFYSASDAVSVGTRDNRSTGDRFFA